MMKIPFGVQLIDDHVQYKIGVHNKVYVWINEKWIRSSKSIDWMNKKLKAQK